MNTSTRTAATLAATFGALAFPASAQEEWTLQGLGIEAGWDYLIDGDARRAVGSSGARVGVTYTLPIEGLLGSAQVGVDFAQHKGNGGRNRSIGVWYNENFHFSGSSVVVPYVGIGVGIVHNNARVERTMVTDGGDYGYGYGEGEYGSITTIEITDDSDFGIGARIAAGVAFNNGIYVEAAGRFASSANEVEQNSVTLSAGFRF